MQPTLASIFARGFVWLLVCLVPLQTLAAMAIATRGPAHSHLPAASTQLVLDDFRRAPVHRLSDATHGPYEGTHAHDAGVAERHHHAPADPTVVIDGVERLQAEEADEMSPGPWLGMFVGLIAVPPCWLADATRVCADAMPRWWLRTRHPAPPERPPRAIG